METTVTSLLPKVSRILIAAEIVLSSPGSSTSETPLRTSRFVFGSSLLTTVLGSGICLIQTYIFIALLPHLKYVHIGCAGCPIWLPNMHRAKEATPSACHPERSEGSRSL